MYWIIGLSFIVDWFSYSILFFVLPQAPTKKWVKVEGAEWFSEYEGGYEVSITSSCLRNICTSKIEYDELL